jgi:hypothetical protein
MYTRQGSWDTTPRGIGGKRVLAMWLHQTLILEGTEPKNGEGTWQALEPTLEERLPLVEACLKRAPDLALLIQLCRELIPED